MKRRSPRRIDKEAVYATYVAWLHEQRCVVCGTRNNIQGSHVGVGGVGLKHGTNADMVPMCGPRWVSFTAPCNRGSYLESGCHADWEQRTWLCRYWDRDHRRRCTRDFRRIMWSQFLAYVAALPTVMPEEAVCAAAIEARLRELEGA